MQRKKENDLMGKIILEICTHDGSKQIYDIIDRALLRHLKEY